MWMSIIAFSATAQTTQLATLQHQDQVSIFYGAESLKQAVAAASDGDVITLSAGQFDAPTFDKELTVRGAGMGIIDAPGYSIPTIINGASRAEKALTVESIYMEELSVKDAITLIKCSASLIYAPRSSYSSRVTIIQSSVKIGNLYQASINALNSVFRNCLNDTNSHKEANLTNCVLIIENGGRISDVTMTNSLLFARYTHLSYYHFAIYNCILCGAIGNASDYDNGTNLILKEDYAAFKENGYYEPNDRFKSFATTDGTEVGIYGGNLGFTQTPNNPQITKFTVAPRTSADGKLSVEIQVEGME